MYYILIHNQIQYSFSEFSFWSYCMIKPQQCSCCVLKLPRYAVSHLAYKFICFFCYYNTCIHYKIIRNIIWFCFSCLLTLSFLFCFSFRKLFFIWMFISFPFYERCFYLNVYHMLYCWEFCESLLSVQVWRFLIDCKIAIML